MPNTIKMMSKKNPTFTKFGRDFIKVFVRCFSLSKCVIFLNGWRTLIALSDLRFVEFVEMSINLNLIISLDLPEDYDYNVEDVPSIPEIGVLFVDEALGNDFKQAFHHEEGLEYQLDRVNILVVGCQTIPVFEVVARNED